MSYTKTLEADGWHVDPIIDPNSGQPSPMPSPSLGGGGWTVPPYVSPYNGQPSQPYTKTLGAGGWVVDPIPDPKADDVVPALKAALATAPTNVAGIQNLTGVTVTYSASTAPPDTPYARHWIAGNGKDNDSGSSANSRVNEIASCFNFEGWEPVNIGGPVVASCSDGSQAQYFHAAKSVVVDAENNTIQTDNPIVFGITTNSRYLYMPSGAGYRAQIEVVDAAGAGRVLSLALQWPTGYHHGQCKIDFGSVAERNIVFRSIGDFWFSEFSITPGATCVPYSPLSGGRVKGAFLGDSYSQGAGDGTKGLCFLHSLATLMGIGAFTASTIGGTGYYAPNVGNPLVWPSAQSPVRQGYINEASPQTVVSLLSINDPQDQPLVRDAMVSVLTALRAANPSAMLVVATPFCPNEASGQNPGGKYQIFRGWLREIMPTLGGRWIFLDGLEGSYLTSAGTSALVGSGPWQKGDGSTTTVDGTHPTEPEFTVIENRINDTYRAALASM